MQQFIFSLKFELYYLSYELLIVLCSRVHELSVASGNDDSEYEFGRIQ
jgi:hypothetical protein